MKPVAPPKHHLKITYEIEPAEKPGEVYVTPIQYLNGNRLQGDGVRYGPMAESLIPAFKVHIEKLYRTTMRKWLDLKKVEAAGQNYVS